MRGLYPFLSGNAIRIDEMLNTEAFKNLLAMCK